MEKTRIIVKLCLRRYDEALDRQDAFGTSICAAAIATNIMWFMAHKKAIAELKSAENSFQNTRSAHDNLQQRICKVY